MKKWFILALIVCFGAAVQAGEEGKKKGAAADLKASYELLPTRTAAFYLGELSLAQMATIAALPKAPSRVNPINSPQETVDRRNYILGRMHQLGYIDQAAWELAVAEPDEAVLHKVKAEASAAYAAEMVRHELVRRYGTSVYASGYEVITTLDVRRQTAANTAVHNGLLDYSRRHGYRGAEAHFDIAAAAAMDNGEKVSVSFRCLLALLTRKSVVTSVYLGKEIHQVNRKACEEKICIHGVRSVRLARQ